MKTIQSFSDALVLYRIKSGQSPQEVAKKIQVNIVELLRWEQGKSLPSEKRIEKISKHLNLELRDKNALLLLAGHTPEQREGYDLTSPVIVDNFILITEFSTMQNESFEIQIQIKDIQKRIEDLEKLVSEKLPKQKDAPLTLVNDVKEALDQIKTSSITNQQNKLETEGQISLLPAGLKPSTLFKVLLKKLNDQELKDLCMHLGSPYDYDDLDGNNRKDKARELIQMTIRRDEMLKLLLELPKINNTITWENF